MTTELTVEGMSCEHCEQTVEEALRDVDGVTAASADRGTDSVTAEGDADPALLVRAIEDAGYEAQT